MESNERLIEEQANRILELEKQIEDYKQIVRNKEGHIEQLLAVEREYENQKRSRSFRFALIIRKISHFFFPEHGKIRFFAKVFLKLVKNPKLMLKVLTPRRIINCFKLMKSEDMSTIYWCMEDAVQKTDKNINNSFEETEIEVYKSNVEMEAKEDISPEEQVALYEKLVLPSYVAPDVSIVIPVYNQFDFTYNCIKSIIANSSECKYEVIIADDCSTDATIYIDQLVENVIVVKTAENVRFLKNCNNAAKQCKGKYVLFLNNDTQVQANWLSSLVELIERDDRIGMVGSMLLYPDGLLQEAGGIIWRDASAWNYGNRQNPNNPEYNYVKEVDYISGASIMIKSDLWNEIGGFDERYAPAYYEDADLAMEVRRHGYKVLFQPLSKVVHFEGISNGTDTSCGQKEYQLLNQETFYNKWKDVLNKEHFDNGQSTFLAKDRSSHKKQILVVDHYVPKHDQDAGGKCTYMYLKLFVKLGMKVTFIGDNFYPEQPYTQELNQLGIEVLYGNDYFLHWKEWLMANGHYFDYIYLQRPHIAIKYIDILKEYSSAKILYFAHDLHHIREYREYELTGDIEKLESSKKWKKIEYELFSKADVGHVVGTYEQGMMQEVFPNKPIRNIPLYIYEENLEDINKDFSTRNDIMYVGGFGHPPNIDAVLWFGKEVFPRILAKYPKMKWYVIGSKVPPEIQEMASENIVILGFVSDEELDKIYRMCRLAVVPLRVGAGVKGKVVEAAYYQIPLVTTSVGAEGLDEKVGNMIIEDTAEGMSEAIIRIYDDYDSLHVMSDCGMKFIKSYFMKQEAERVIHLDIE